VFSFKIKECGELNNTYDNLSSTFHPKFMKQYDALIIGSGQGGTPLAKKLAGAGYKTALIERRWVGGTCVNDGCTPTKAMIASAKTAHTIKTAMP
jgi:pyruvate/2-oxoglutarate dehydrogenase complex dihydrolipoamide dehydrogenase (E3) component